MFKLLKSEHKGAIGTESIILSPLILLTFIFLLYYFFMVVTYISYNNVANSIAKQLNMRQTGYNAAISKYKDKAMPRIWSYRNNIYGNGEIGEGYYLSESQIVVEPSTDALKNGTYYALEKFSENFIIPFSEVKKVKVTTTKSVEPSKGRALAGTVIAVEIDYTSMNIFGVDHGVFTLPLMKAVGYNIIS